MQTQKKIWTILHVPLQSEVRLVVNTQGQASASVTIWKDNLHTDAFILDNVSESAGSREHTFRNKDVLSVRLRVEPTRVGHALTHIKVMAELTLSVKQPSETGTLHCTLASFDLAVSPVPITPPHDKPSGPTPPALPRENAPTARGCALFPYIELQRQPRLKADLAAAAFASPPDGALRTPWYLALVKSPPPSLAALRQAGAAFAGGADFIPDPAAAPDSVLLVKSAALIAAAADPQHLQAQLLELFGAGSAALMKKMLATPEWTAMLEKLWQSYFAVLLIGAPDPHQVTAYTGAMRAAHLLGYLFAPPDQAGSPTPATLAMACKARIVLPAPLFPLPRANSGAASMPTLMIGELDLVEQRLLRYELGELAHIESLMPGERREIVRKHTRAHSSAEQEQAQHGEHVDSEGNEAREMLVSQVQQAIAEKAVSHNYNKFTTTYGPPTEATLDGKCTEMTLQGRRPATEDATRFARQILNRTVNRIARDVVHTRASGRFDQWENSVNSVIDNSAVRSPQLCAFRWINKVMEARVMRYGLRLMLEFSIPHPARDYGAMQLGADGALAPLPQALAAQGVASFAGVTEANYAALAAAYGVTELTPPPAARRIVSQSLRSGDDMTLAVPSGYVVSTAAVSYINERDGAAQPTVLVGRERFRADETKEARVFGEETAIAVAVPAPPLPPLPTLAPDADGGTGAAPPPPGVLVNVTIECTPAAATIDAWRIRTYEALLKGYQRQLASFHGDTGGHAAARPRANARRIEAEALKRACLQALLARMDLPADCACTGTPYGIALQFLEDALEWQEMSARFYSGAAKVPHPVGGACDSARFTAFLEADFAVVALPVQPGQALALLYGLAEGQCWDGPPALVPVHVAQLALAQALDQAPAGADAAEALGQPWEIVVPTALQSLDSGFRLGAPGAGEARP